MPRDAKTMLAPEFISKADEILIFEFDQLLTLLAVQMVVLGVAIIVLVYIPTIQFELSQKSSFDELFQRSIYGGSADLSLDVLNQGFRIEVFMAAEDFFQYNSAWFCPAFPSALEILFKAFQGGKGNANSS